MNRLTRVLPGAALLLAAALALACGQKPTEIRLKSTKLKVTGLGRVVSVGGDVVDKKGEIVPGKTVTWESSNPKVATVNGETGSVKTVGQGKARIIARLGDPPLEAIVALEVLDVALVNVFPARTTLAGPAGSTFSLALEVKDTAGKVVEMKAEWTSSAPTVATVDASGVMTSVGEGKASVKATVGDVTGTSEIVVVFRTIDTLEASPLNIPLKVGEMGKVDLVARDPQGAAIPDVAATWTSSDPTVATCSGGTVLGIGPGSTTIRAACGAKSAEVSVIVF
ncbi:MAG TPA: Ig-like domain-containing protein [Thermoanaerobaculia bacterium]|nr:Ig-like domain-containing protein [Thermoanaerobaculia bacterium]